MASSFLPARSRARIGSCGLAACAIVPLTTFDIIHPVLTRFRQKEFAQLAMQGQDAWLKRSGGNLHFLNLPV
jgi:hypothetical protein